jgi:hypothetical protein
MRMCITFVSGMQLGLIMATHMLSGRRLRPAFLLLISSPTDDSQCCYTEGPHLGSDMTNERAPGLGTPKTPCQATLKAACVDIDAEGGRGVTALTQRHM